MSLGTVFAFLLILGVPAAAWLRLRRNSVPCASCGRRYGTRDHRVRYVPHLDVWVCLPCLTRDPYLPWRQMGQMGQPRRRWPL